MVIDVEDVVIDTTCLDADDTSIPYSELQTHLDDQYATMEL